MDRGRRNLILFGDGVPGDTVPAEPANMLSLFTIESEETSFRDKQNWIQLLCKCHAYMNELTSKVMTFADRKFLDRLLRIS